jgi:hypothetical protein
VYVWRSGTIRRAGRSPADGQKFVFVMLDPEAEAGTLNAILNWTSLLGR